jgi:penicillin-binding protein 1A
MNALYHGGPVDGGTYPADIWHAYMSQAHGKFCGAFPLPKEPFVSQPFFGHYSSTGGRGPGGTVTGPTGATATPTPGTSTPPATTPTPGNGTGGAFDPNQYETPPQGPPNVKKPPSRGNGTPAH